MKTDIHFLYFAQFFLRRETFRTKVEEKIKTHFMIKIFFGENRAAYDLNVGGKNHQISALCQA
jgi:hypothetical protein